MRPHAWVAWADIAIQHEALAWGARRNHDVYEFKPGLVALTSAAFALDAPYGVATHLIPPPGTSSCRSAQVAERLKRGVSPGKLASKWPGRIRHLFDERDAAVHFGEETLGPVWHATLESNVAPHVLRWGADAATRAVDVLMDVLTTWAAHPSKRTASWATSFGPSVDALSESRRRHSPPT